MDGIKNIIGYSLSITEDIEVIVNSIDDDVEEAEDEIIGALNDRVES